MLFSKYQLLSWLPALHKPWPFLSQSLQVGCRHQYLPLYHPQMWAFWNVHLVIYLTHSRPPAMPASDDRIASWLTRLHSISLLPLPSFRYTGLLTPKLALRNCLCSLWPSSQNRSWWESPHLEMPRRLILILGAKWLIWGYETLSRCLKVGQCWGEMHAPELWIRLDFTWDLGPALPLPLPLLASLCPPLLRSPPSKLHASNTRCWLCF